MDDKQNLAKKEQPVKKEAQNDSNDLPEEEGSGFPEDVDFKKFLGCGG